MKKSGIALLALALAACSSGPEQAQEQATAPGGTAGGDSGGESDSGPAATPSAVASPSFDCAKADTDAMKMVCGDAGLAAMDRELTRLYGLALAGSHMTPDREKELKAMQRGWIKGRDDCWKADDRHACVFSSYAGRINELRQGYFDVRAKDSEGISSGPVALACDGVNFGISASFVKSDPGSAFLQWNDQSVALAQVSAGAGARYEGANYAGKSTLFMKGDNAMVTLPGEAQEYSCHVEEID